MRSLIAWAALLALVLTALWLGWFRGADPVESEPGRNRGSSRDLASGVAIDARVAEAESAGPEPRENSLAAERGAVERVAQVHRPLLELRDSNGEAVPGLELCLWDISVDTGDILGYLGTVEACDRLYLEPDRTERIRAAALRWTSDAQGALGLTLEDLPAETRLLAAVTAPGWKPWSAVFERREDLEGLGEVVLEAGPNRTLFVDGAVPGAGEVHLRVQAMLPSGAVPESLPVDVRARRAVTHDVVLGGVGAASLPPIEGRVALWAWQGDLRSEVFVGELDVAPRLALRPTFTVEGAVRREDGEPLGAYAHVVVSRWDAALRRWEQQATAMVVEGGRYGPVRVPAVEDARCRLSVRWTEAGEDDRVIGVPQAGERLVEDFLLGPNRDVWIHVWGAVPGGDDVVELGGARVQARWTRPSGGSFARDKTTIASGWVRFGGIEPGDGVVFQASAEGYATSPGHAHVMSEAGIAPFNLVLQPAAERVLSITHRGAPVEACLLVRSESDTWQSAAGDWRSSEGQPGRFTVQPSEGPCWVRAVLPGVGASRPVRLEPAGAVGEEGSAESLELTILDGPTGVGQVVDARSGAPVPAARVALVEPPRGGASLEAAASQAVAGVGGLFELGGLPPANAEQEVVVQAPGYRTLRRALPARSAEASTIDLGLFEIEPERTVVLEVAERSGSVAVMSAWGSGVRGNQKRSVRPGESLSWQALDDTVYLQVFFDEAGDFGPAWDWITASAQDAEGDAWVVAYPPPAASALDTDLRVPAEWAADAALWPLRVFFYGENAPAGLSREARFTEPGARVRQPGLDPGAYQVRALSAAGEELGRIEWRLEAGMQRATLSFDAPSLRFQLVANDGRDVEGALVHLKSASDVALTTPATADADGWLQSTLNFQSERASGVLVDGACFGDVAIDWSGADGGDPVGFIRVGPFRSTAMRCEGVLGPLEGVAWSLHPATWGTALATGRSAADGRIEAPPLMDGSYRLELSLPGYWPHAVSIEPGVGEVPLWMARRSRLRAEVLAPGGAPLSDEALHLHHVELNAGSDYWIARGQLESAALRTDAEGRLDVDGLPEGTYRFFAREGAWSGEAQVSDSGSESVVVQLSGT